MELNIINQSIQQIVVFASNELFKYDKVATIIKPNDILKKIAYAYYWKQQPTVDTFKILQNYLNYKLQNSMTYLGVAPDESNMVQMLNVNNVPEYIYIFYTILQDDKKTTSLNMVTIPSRYYFTKYDTYAISNYTILYIYNKTIPAVANADEVNQTLKISYTSVGDEVASYIIDWTPNLPDTTCPTCDKNWMMPLLFLLFLIIIFAVIFGVFKIMYKESKNIVYNVSKKNTVLTEKKEVPKEQLFLD